MRFYTLLLLCFLLSCCYQSKRNCIDYKTGTFKSTIIIDNKEYTSVFTRNESIQVETFEGKTDSAIVRWINDCEMIFKTINPKSMAERKDVHLKILKTNVSRLPPTKLKHLPSHSTCRG